MKKNILLNAGLSLATAFVLMALPACKKDDVQPSQSKTQLITKANWKIVKIEEKNATGNWVNITSTMDACELDNIIIFRSNLSYEINEGVTKCEASDPQINETGSWKFENNETQLSFTETGSATAALADIVEITADSLILTRSYNENGDIYNFRVSFRH